MMGAALAPDEVKKILGMERVIGLAEVMDYSGVISGKPRISPLSLAVVPEARLTDMGIVDVKSPSILPSIP